MLPRIKSEGMLRAKRWRASIRVKLASRFPWRGSQITRLDIEGARAFVFVLAIGKRRTTMPAEPRRDRLRLANDAVLLVARKIDDVAG
ncbi:hypothetical protein JQ609_29525 [Bradyrhizobium sp. AUGA SZCCT0169]|uniref:hypothetical protein n=1 Tax=Bradyrhizobium sp. AUGA SZCCT0169 TaxID=2807663 RepID=UPI001BACD1E8|nr:hypothetical protein [Bradyrhizobium sp. AUGA SZCCT0169]MBR1251049.1 hypothetical protein [Bradyrhizobium sp. AUGA SZCCT0169]